MASEAKASQLVRSKMEHSGSVFDCSRARSCATSRNKSSGWFKDADMKMGDWIQSTPGRNNNLQMRSRKLRRGIIELQKMLGLVGLTFFRPNSRDRIPRDQVSMSTVSGAGGRGG